MKHHKRFWFCCGHFTQFIMFLLLTLAGWAQTGHLHHSETKRGRSCGFFLLFQRMSVSEAVFHCRHLHSPYLKYVAICGLCMCSQWLDLKCILAVAWVHSHMYFKPCDQIARDNVNSRSERGLCSLLIFLFLHSVSSVSLKQAAVLKLNFEFKETCEMVQGISLWPDTVNGQTTHAHTHIHTPKNCY